MNQTRPDSMPRQATTVDHREPVRRLLLHPWWRRVLALVPLAALALLAWGWLAQQHALLWVRLAPAAVERFVADAVSVPLPAPEPAHELRHVCSAPPQGLARWSRAAARRQAAACLADPALQPSGAALRQALEHHEAALEAQQRAASAWLQAHDAMAAPIRDRLRAELQALQAAPPHALARGAGEAMRRGWLPAGEPRTAPRETTGTEPAADVAAALARRATEAGQRAQRVRMLPPEQRLAALALLARGLELRLDHGHAPARPYLVSDRSTLADALQRLDRAQGYAARGFSLTDLHRLPGALFTTALLMLAAGAIASAARPLPTALWAAAGWLLGAGALVLTDLALTGDPALRYLAVRQYLRFAFGDAVLPLTTSWRIGGFALEVWVPGLVAAAAALVLMLCRGVLAAALAPLQGWLTLASHGRWGMLPVALLFLLGAGAVLTVAQAAALSEWLIFLGVAGLATFLAQQAALANAGGRVQAGQWLIAGAALACAVGGALWRGDLGHALVALALGAAFVWLFAPRGLRHMAPAALAAGSVLVALVLVAEGLPGPVAAAAEALLPHHALGRLEAWLDPFRADSSDLARMRWLMDSAGGPGWGPGYVPWQGLAPERTGDGLPLQGPSDYTFGLVWALFGSHVGLAVLTALLVVFVAAGAIGLRAALRPGAHDAQRLLAAVGGFGCLVMALKAMLSIGGVSGVLPLTGLPVALLGYGPMTLAAALIYLTLALAAASHEPTEPELAGVNWRPRPPVRGPVSQRSHALGWGLVVVVTVLAAAAGMQVAAGVGEKGARHLAQSRLALAQAARAALAEGSAPQGVATTCRELDGAVQAWNRRLAEPTRAEGEAGAMRLRHFDPSRFEPASRATRPAECRRLARRLGALLDDGFARVAGALPAVAHDPARRALPGPRPAAGVRPLDFATHNAWWGVPGCVQVAGASDDPCLPAADLDLATDPWLDRDLMPPLHLALRRPAETTWLNGRPVARGPTLALTLDPRLQDLAQRIADCYTGRRAGAALCDTAWPADAQWRDSHFGGPAPLRAGAIGIVLSEVDSGRIVALAGAISDCSLAQLHRRAATDDRGRTPALRPGLHCAQLPDDRSAWVATQHPALWPVPPGSALKGLAVAAGIDAGLVPAERDAYWKGVLAQSVQREPVQALALAAGARYLEQLSGLGFGQPAPELLWGGRDARPAPPAPAITSTHWYAPSFQGAERLRPSTMTFDEAERIRREKSAGINVDRRHGPAVMAEFLDARRLADAALGGGDVRVSALGLVQLWRVLDLRARTRRSAPPLHLLESPGAGPAAAPFDWVSEGAARRVLEISAGVTAAAWKGTAQGSCRVVFGHCPPLGLAGVSGKTGSADFLLSEHSPHVKPGQQFPAKLFAGVFTAPDGRRYAVSVMATRVRASGRDTLELAPSAPAEAALTLMREMGLRPESGPQAAVPAPRRPARLPARDPRV